MLKRFIRTQALLFVAAGLMAACNTTSQMDMPKLKSYELMEVNKPLSEQTTFALSKIVANLKRGTTIIHFPAAGVEGIDSSYCNYSHQGESTIEWGAGTSVLGNWSTELGEVFHEVLTQKGLHIAGDPKDLFGQKETVSSAEYLIGARISEIKVVSSWSPSAPTSRVDS